MEEIDESLKDDPLRLCHPSGLIFARKQYPVFQFLLLLAAKVTSVFDSLTRPERVKVLVLDDSVVKRNRSKAVELLARVYDHVEHKYQKGFTMLALGWSDGLSVALKRPSSGFFASAGNFIIPAGSTKSTILPSLYPYKLCP